MRILTVLSMMFLMVQFVFAQGNLKPVPQMIKSYQKMGADFQSTSLFQSKVSDASKRSDIQKVVTNATLLTLDQTQLRAMLKAEPEALNFVLPRFQKKDLEIQLVKANIIADGFRVRLSDQKDPIYPDLGVHYRGIIKGNTSSLAAISIFENEISGFVSDDSGNMILGKLEGTNPKNEHILYYDNQMSVVPDISCGVVDDERPYTSEDLEESPNRDAGDCVKIYVEANKDLYDGKGSGTTSYITGFFNQSATLYANESINIYLSDLYIWTTSSPYTSSSTSTLLSQFQNYRNSFNGDIGHLVGYAGGGGIAAGFSAVCNPNLDANMCYSGVQSSYSNVPTWSWTVSVFVHEMGHLFGSRHTHACVWNGNNTAIDGCAGSTEGSCSNPGSPSGGGTIMSYCHFTTGINFNLGFGSQPGAVIRNRIAGASCLAASCDGTTPTCSDGVQNGDETGVDCGGASCPACPTNCTSNDLTLTITLDNYPEETSWSITSNGSTVASGGTYGNQADGTTISIPLCLDNGCYDFNIFDAYGDGICCGYGNGSYSLSGGGTTYASGGQFTNSETTNFCVDSTPAPTCTDGIQNGNETGVDCGGSCPACPTGGGCTDIDITSQTINAYGAGQDNGVSNFGADYLVIYNNAWKSISLNYTITANTVLEFDFGSTTQGEIHGIGFDSDDAISSNLTFKLYGSQNWGISNYRYTSVGNWQSFSIPVGQFYTGTADRLFFVADHDSGASNGNSYFRNIRINEGGCMPSTAMNGAIIGHEHSMNNAFTTSNATIFPNPAQDVLNVTLTNEVGEVELSIIDLYGRVVAQQQTGTANAALSLTDLASGMYFLRIENENFKQVEKFIIER